MDVVRRYPRTVSALRNLGHGALAYSGYKISEAAGKYIDGNFQRAGNYVLDSAGRAAVRAARKARSWAVSTQNRRRTDRQGKFNANRAPPTPPKKSPNVRKSVTTQTKKVRSKVIKMSSKPSGFLRRPSKLPRKSRRMRISRNGVYGTVESYDSISAVDCAYVGHSTSAVNQMKLYMFLALVKRVVVAHQGPVDDFDKLMIFDHGYSLGDIFNIQYRPDNEVGTLGTSYTYTIGALSTLSAVAEAIRDHFNTLTTNEWTLEEIVFAPANLGSYSKVRLNLKNASVTFDIKSTLKMQNRTVDTSTDKEADDVNNVPLNGKSYEGSGNGTQYTKSNDGSQGLWCDPVYGLIANNGAGSQREPPMGHLFKGVSRAGKVRFEPGALQTSTLTMFKTFKLFTLVKQLYVNVKSKSIISLGSFRFYALEKMIGGQSEQPIEVVFEHNYFIGCEFVPGKFTYSVSLYTKQVVP